MPHRIMSPTRSGLPMWPLPGGAAAERPRPSTEGCLILSREHGHEWSTDMSGGGELSVYLGLKNG